MDEIETTRVLEIAIDNATSRGDTRVILHPTRAKQILAALRSAQVPKWRPIETAPRNELVLVYDYRKNQFSIGGVYKFTYATHWMPLPAAPSAEGV